MNIIVRTIFIIIIIVFNIHLIEYRNIVRTSIIILFNIDLMEYRKSILLLGQLSLLLLLI